MRELRSPGSAAGAGTWAASSSQAYAHSGLGAKEQAAAAVVASHDLAVLGYGARRYGDCAWHVPGTVTFQNFERLKRTAGQCVASGKGKSCTVKTLSAQGIAGQDLASGTNFEEPLEAEIGGCADKHRQSLHPDFLVRAGHLRSWMMQAT